MEIKSTEIKLIDISEIKENEHNRNTHPEDQIARLADIIKAEGFRVPLIVSNRSGLLVAGHGRLLAARMLGLTKLPVSFQDFDNEEQEYRVGISDNAVAEWSEIDMSQIHKDLENLQPFDLTLLGFRDFTFEPDPVIGLTDEDSVPENVISKVKLGDLFILGNHRLLCGDATNIQHVEKLLNGEKADMVFTDPPYGYEYESNYQDKHSVLKNDDKILDFLPCAYSVMHENSCIYVCGSHQTITQWKTLIEKTFTYKNLIVWKKNNWSMGDLSGSYAGQHELIIFAHKGRIELNGERSRDVWEFNRDPPKDHPTQKPVDLISFALEKTSKSNNVVLDLFGGSGSTLIACEKTNRKCFMSELDPKYCSVIIERWKQFTGKEAFLLNEDHTQTPWSDITTRT